MNTSVHLREPRNNVLYYSLSISISSGFYRQSGDWYIFPTHKNAKVIAEGNEGRNFDVVDIQKVRVCWRKKGI